MIQPGRPSNREKKLCTRQENLAAMAPLVIPEFLNGSETVISFSKEDYPPSVAGPRHAALVLDAQIGKYGMSKVFMDGGSRINIIFADTLRKMNRSVKNLPRSSNTFHGIVPSKAVSPEGTIQLDITFGDKSHFRTDTLEFRNCRLEITISRHTRATSIRKVHGGPTLRISPAQDARAKRNYHRQR